MKQLIEGDRQQYMLAQEEALKLFAWLKKFADAYLKE
jgi:CRISPR/Cas system CMR-associated protein Cmr5 small subunit